jgi:hypothetical protein
MWAWDRYTWLPGATAGKPIMDPNETGWIECAIAALADTGLDGSERMDAVEALPARIRSTQSAGAAGTPAMGHRQTAGAAAGPRGPLPRAHRRRGIRRRFARP